MRLLAVVMLASAACGRFGFASLTLVHEPPNMRCLATWKGIAYEASGPIPTDIPADEFFVAANNVDLAADYFVRIEPR